MHHADHAASQLRQRTKWPTLAPSGGSVSDYAARRRLEAGVTAVAHTRQVIALEQQSPTSDEAVARVSTQSETLAFRRSKARASGTLIIRSVLLAAGRGERLRPLTEQVPKACVPLLDVPLGAFGLRALLSRRRPVAINVSHLGDIAIDKLRPFATQESAEFFVEVPGPYGSGGTLRELSARLEFPLVTQNADLLTDLDPAILLEAHVGSGAPATVAVRPVDSGADFEIADGRAVRFIDRRVQRTEPGAQFLGVAVLERSAVDLIPSTTPVSLAESVLRPLANAGELAVHMYRGYSSDVGTIERYLSASFDLLEGRGPAPPTRTGQTGVWPGRVVEVGGRRAYLGPRARAEPGSVGPGAILLESASVASGARIEDAIVWPHEHVPANVNLRRAVWTRRVAVTA
jgi:NDP-sugar pyrophosphorylase family protein